LKDRGGESRQGEGEGEERKERGRGRRVREREEGEDEGRGERERRFRILFIDDSHRRRLVSSTFGMHEVSSKLGDLEISNFKKR
jgi:hypothetical protein